MNTRFALGIISVLMAVWTHECLADLNGSDDFSSLTKDTSKWGTDSTTGVGLLTQTNGQLKYSTSGTPTTRDIVIRPWILNFGSYTQNWEAQMDLSLPPFAGLTGTQFVSFGLVVFPGNNPNTAFTNRFDMDLGQVSNSAPDFECTIAANGSMNEVVLPTASPYTAIRIAFDAGTKELSGFYDEGNPACGYSWTLLMKTNVSALWNLTNTSVFSVAAIGNSHSMAVALSNNVFGDNFRTSSGTTPSLRINQTGSKVTLAWATNGAVCHLESASTLASPICWQTVTNSPAIVSTNFTVTNAISNRSLFYRLSR